jgi:hypothetical protein
MIRYFPAISLMSLISVAKYSSVILGIFVILFGFQLNQTSCLAPLIACDPKVPWTCQPYNCPQILWPYFWGASLIILGIVLWVLPTLGFFHNGTEQNEEVASTTSYQG